MRGSSWPAAPVGGIALLAVAVCATACGARDRTVWAGFWFEQVSYDSSEAMVRPLGGAISATELQTIEEVARDEVVRAFSPLRIRVTGDHNATYRVRVVQELRNLRAPWSVGPAAESRSVPGLGGEGAVNFRMIVSNAVAYADGADRQGMIRAIGKGIGRAAVHEFAHQLLGRSQIHSSDRASYEYDSSARREQYYGELHWAGAWPALQRRVGVK